MTPWRVRPVSEAHKRTQDALIPESASRRFWFWKPEWHWHGWTTLLPFQIGGILGDEYGRRTCIIGWTITGRIIVVWSTCYCDECDASREQSAYWRSVDGAGS